MKKMLSLMLACMMLVMPVLSFAEESATLESTMANLGAAKNVLSNLTAWVEPGMLTSMGMTEENAQALVDFLAEGRICTVTNKNLVYAELDYGDAVLMNGTVELDGDTVYMVTNLLSNVYSADAKELMQSMNAAQASNAPAGMDQALVQEITEKAAALPYNFDKTTALVTSYMEKLTMTETGFSITLTADEIVTFLRTAADDLLATPGFTQLVAEYAPSVTDEVLNQIVTESLSQIAAAITGGYFTVAYNNEDGVNTVAIVVQDETAAGYGLSATLNGSTVALGFYQITAQENVLLGSVSVGVNVTDTDAAILFSVMLGEYTYYLNLSAQAAEDVLSLSAQLDIGDATIAVMSLQCSAYEEEFDASIEDKAAAIDTKSLTEEDQQAMFMEAAQNFRAVLQESAAALPQSVRALMGM